MATTTTATTTATTATSSITSSICGASGNFPTVLPDVSNSVSWCGVSYSNLTNTAAMTSCCGNGTVYSQGTCQWCTSPNGENYSAALLEQDFDLCLETALKNRGEAPTFGLHCNEATAESSAGLVLLHNGSGVLMLTITALLVLPMVLVL